MVFWFGKVDDSQYADENWLCWWENYWNEVDKNIFLDGFLNRNSLHVDVTWEVVKNKTLLQRFLDSLNWVRDDDSWYRELVVKKWYFQEPMTTYFESNKDIWYIISYLQKEQIYFPWKGVNGVSFVRLNDKWKYILELKTAILRDIKIFFETWEKSKLLELLNYTTDENGEEKVRGFYRLWYITRSEIIEVIESFFSKKSRDFIDLILVYGIWKLKELNLLDLRILAWGVNHNFFIRRWMETNYPQYIVEIEKYYQNWALTLSYLSKLWLE